MPRSSRDEEFSAFVQTRRTELVRSACLLMAGDRQVRRAGQHRGPNLQIAGRRWVIVQAPVSLGWDSAELAKFASGVQVLVTAQQGRGRACLPSMTAAVMSLTAAAVRMSR